MICQKSSDSVLARCGDFMGLRWLRSVIVNKSLTPCEPRPPHPLFFTVATAIQRKVGAGSTMETALERGRTAGRLRAQVGYSAALEPRSIAACPVLAALRKSGLTEYAPLLSSRLGIFAPKGLLAACRQLRTNQCVGSFCYSLE